MIGPGAFEQPSPGPNQQAEGEERQSDSGLEQTPPQVGLLKASGQPQELQQEPASQPLKASKLDKLEQVLQVLEDNISQLEEKRPPVPQPTATEPPAEPAAETPLPEPPVAVPSNLTDQPPPLLAEPEPTMEEAAQPQPALEPSPQEVSTSQPDASQEEVNQPDQDQKATSESAKPTTKPEPDKDPYGPDPSSSLYPVEKEVADSLATEEVGRFFAALAPLLDAVTTSPKLADFILQTLDKISDPQLKKIFLNRLEIERRELNDWIDKLDSFLKEWEQNRVVREIIAIDHAEIASIIQDLESTRTEIDTAISGSNQMVPEEENDEADENENQPATSPQRAAPYNESDENNSGEIIPVLSNNQNKENLDLVGNRQTEGNANNQSVNPFIRASELNTVIHKSVSEIATDGIPRRFASNVKKLFKGE